MSLDNDFADVELLDALDIFSVASEGLTDKSSGGFSSSAVSSAGVVDSGDDGDENDNDSNDDNGSSDDDDEDGTHNRSKKRRRGGSKKFKEEDSELIKMATDENLRSMNVDPNSQEGKLIKRKIRNRMSAQFHRERKKAYIDDLELLIKEKDAVIEVLRKRNTELVKANEDLKTILHTVQRGAHVSVPVQFNHNQQPHHHNIQQYQQQQQHYQHQSQMHTSQLYGQQPQMHAPQPQMQQVQMHHQQMHQSQPHTSSTATLTSSHHYVSPMTSDTDDSDSSVSSQHSSGKGSSSSLGNSTHHNQIHPVVTWENTHSSIKNSIPPALDSNKYLSDGMWSSSSFGLTHSSSKYDHTPSYWLDRALDEHDNVIIKDSSSSIPAISPPHFDLDSSKVAPGITSSITASPSTALWTYQDRSLQLYPRKTIKDRGAAPRTSVRTPAASSAPSVSSHKNLRGDLDSDSEVVILPPQQTWETWERVAGSAAATTNINRILMTSGAALLDPHLYVNRPPVTIIPQQHGSNDNVDGGDVSSRELSWVSDEKILKQPAQPIILNTNMNSNNAHTSFGDMNDNVLVMLLPASSIRWGNSWSDSKDRDMNWMLNKSDIFQDPDVQQEQLWVEIICTISSAHIVKNVTLANSV